MPLYEYHCPYCSNKDTRIRKMNDTSLVLCALCAYPTERIVSRSNFIFDKKEQTLQTLQDAIDGK